MRGELGKLLVLECMGDLSVVHFLGCREGTQVTQGSHTSSGALPR